MSVAFVGLCEFDGKLRVFDCLGPQDFKKNLTVMAKEASNGDSHGATKPPPSPSPLRNSKFFQVIMVILDRVILLLLLLFFFRSFFFFFLFKKRITMSFQ
jgi:hypothetical protein